MKADVSLLNPRMLVLPRCSHCGSSLFGAPMPRTVWEWAQKLLTPTCPKCSRVQSTKGN